MTRRRSRMAGDFKLRRTLRTIHQTMDNELRTTMQAAAHRVLTTMQSLVPRDTGAAAAALKAYVSKSGLDAQIGIRGKKDNRRFFYLRFLEYGIKGYSGAQYRRADAAAVSGSHNKNRNGGAGQGSAKNKSNGATFFGKYPDIPARVAHPWLRPALDVNRELVLASIRQAVGRTLKKASEGTGND